MKKSTLIILIALVIIAGVYFYISGSSAPAEDSLLALETNSEIDATASRVLSLLNQIRSLQIDPNLFQGAAYKTLRDYSVSIPAQGVGRLNPFAPI